jgi:hypothetical protein
LSEPPASPRQSQGGLRLDEPGSAPLPPADQEPGRRSLLITLAFFGALALVVSGVSLLAGSFRGPAPSAPSSAPAEAPDPRVLAYLGPLAEGKPFGRSHVTRVGPLERGGITLEIAAETGAPLVVDLRAFSPTSPKGIAETKRVALYLRTSPGAQTTEDAQRACVELAAALAAREEAGHEPPALEPLAPAKR